MRSYVLVLTIGLLAACGDDGTNHLADAAPGIDARHIDGALPIDAPAAGPVTVTVTLRSVGAAGVPVYFLDADSTVVLDTTTGADGKASAVMAAGGSVTVIAPQNPDVLPPDGEANLDTFAGVKPGDDLHVDVAPADGTETFINFDVTVPSIVGANEYDIDTECGGGVVEVGLRARATQRAHRLGTPVSFTGPVSLVDCAATTNILIAAVFNDGEGDFTLLGTIFLPNQAVADGVPLVVDAAYVAPIAQTVTMTNPSPTTTFYDLETNLLGSGGFLEFDASAGANPGSGSASVALSLTYPPAASVPNTTEALFLELDPDNTVSDEQDFTVWGPTADTQTIDLSKLALQDYATRPQYDFASQQFLWLPTASGLAPDLVFGQFRVTRTNPDNVEEPFGWTWSLAAPGSETGKLQVPTLPTDVFDFTPQAGDDMFVEQVETGKVPGGYDAVRAQIFSEEALFGEPPPGTTGHVSITELEDTSLKAKHRVTHPRHRRAVMSRRM